MCAQSLRHPYHQGTALSKDRRDWHCRFLSSSGPGTGTVGMLEGEIKAFV